MFDSLASVSLALRATVLACILVPGLLMAVTPWLMPKGEVFAVTLPAEATRDPRVRALRRRYMGAIAAATLALAAMAFADLANVVLLVALALALPLLGFLGMLVCRSRVRALKRDEGWQVETGHATAVELPKGVPGPISLWWNLLYVPVICATVALTAALYPSMPGRIVMQVGFDGQVTSWADKTPWSAGFPVITQLFMTAMLVACHVAATRSKRPGLPGAPMAGALRYGRFAQVQTVALLGMGLGLTAGMALIPFADAGYVSLGTAALVLVALTLAALVASVLLALRCGQAGALLVNAPHGDVCDEDVYWRGGVFYVNSDDPSVVVPSGLALAGRSTSATGAAGSRSRRWWSRQSCSARVFR